MGDQVHLLQAQVAGFARLAGGQPPHAGGGVKGQAAGAGAGAPVAAAPAQEGAHHALAADPHAERAVDEHLALDGAGGADGADLLQREFTRQDHPVIAQVGQRLRPRRGVDAHLGGAVQRQGGGDLFDQPGGGKIVGDDRVGPRLGHGAHRLGQAGQLAAVHQGVQRHVHPHAPPVAEAHGFPQPLRRKIARREPRVEAGQPQINSISAAEHSGA